MCVTLLDSNDWTVAGLCLVISSWENPIYVSHSSLFTHDFHGWSDLHLTLWLPLSSPPFQSSPPPTAIIHIFAKNHYIQQREEILANRARQKQHLEKLMAEAHQKLSDHKSGRKPLTEEDLAEWEKKYHIYQRKLDTMEGDMDEREVERIQKREELRHHRDEERRRRRQQEEEEL